MQSRKYPSRLPYHGMIAKREEDYICYILLQMQSSLIFLLFHHCSIVWQSSWMFSCSCPLVLLWLFSLSSYFTVVLTAASQAIQSFQLFHSYSYCSFTGYFSLPVISQLSLLQLHRLFSHSSSLTVILIAASHAIQSLQLFHSFTYCSFAATLCSQFHESHQGIIGKN